MRTAFRLMTFLSLLFLGWRLLRWLSGIHSLLLLIALLAFLLNVVTVWLIRTSPHWVASVCRNQPVRSYVGFVCWCMGRQLPTASDPDVRGRMLLRTPAEFRVAAGRAKEIVRGHDHVIEGVLDRIRENCTLSRSRRKGKSGPLASFFLIGRQGVGKRYLLRVLSKLLFRGGCVDVFCCKRVTPAYLIGSKSQPGKLIEIATSRPGTVVLFESIEDASPQLQEFLVQLVTNGQLPGAAAQNLDRSIIAFSTSRLPETADVALSNHVSADELVRTLVDESVLNRNLVGAVTDSFIVSSPTDRTRAEVIALLMKKECRDHRIKLSHVDAEILAMQVVQIEDDGGFELTPQRVKKLLRKPLVAIHSSGQQSLALRLTTQLSHAPGT